MHVHLSTCLPLTQSAMFLVFKLNMSLVEKRARVRVLTSRNNQFVMQHFKHSTVTMHLSLATKTSLKKKSGGCKGAMSKFILYHS